jgi:hypothetical protein
MRIKFNVLSLFTTPLSNLCALDISAIYPTKFILLGKIICKHVDCEPCTHTNVSFMKQKNINGLIGQEVGEG